MECMYLVFTRMPGSYRRRLMSWLLCTCNVFRALTPLFANFMSFTQTVESLIYRKRIGNYVLIVVFRAQELCESRGGRP